ncbi:MAG: tail fiber domain-containing protein, partial [Terracidiphilus sp.]
IRGTKTGSKNAVEVMIDSNGQLGTVNSSIRFKEDVHDMAAASEGLMRLRPVTYRYKQPYDDGTKPVDYGLIAEEVAEVYPDLVVKDADGQIQTVQYQKLTPMLLNEVQKEHKQLEEQEKTIQLLQKRLAALESALRSADAQPETK